MACYYTLNYDCINLFNKIKHINLLFCSAAVLRTVLTIDCISCSPVYSLSDENLTAFQLANVKCTLHRSIALYANFIILFTSQLLISLLLNATSCRLRLLALITNYCLSSLCHTNVESKSAIQLAAWLVRTYCNIILKAGLCTLNALLANINYNLLSFAMSVVVTALII